MRNYRHSKRSTEHEEEYGLGYGLRVSTVPPEEGEDSDDRREIGSERAPPLDEIVSSTKGGVWMNAKSEARGSVFLCGPELGVAGRTSVSVHLLHRLFEGPSGKMGKEMKEKGKRRSADKLVFRTQGKPVKRRKMHRFNLENKTMPQLPIRHYGTCT
jgi:hypothetical protein